MADNEVKLIEASYRRLQASFRPEFGNQDHIDIIHNHNKVKELESRLKSRKDTGSTSYATLKKEVIWWKNLTVKAMEKANANSKQRREGGKAKDNPTEQSTPRLL